MQRVLCYLYIYAIICIMNRRGEKDSPLHGEPEHERKIKRIKAVTVPLIASLALVSCGTTSPDKNNYYPAPDTPTQSPTDCAVNGQPATPEQMLCHDRRVGKIAIVTIPELKTPDGAALNLAPNSKDVIAAADYATNLLKLATNGGIALSPDIIQASPVAVKEISDKNSAGCIDTSQKSDLMGAIVKESMPETAGFAQVMAVGGQACIDSEGQVIGGIAAYAPSRDMLDIYNRTPPPKFFMFGDETSITTAGSTMAHELLHNYGLGHSGTLRLKDYKSAGAIIDAPSGAVDLEAYLKLPATYNEYGSMGNVMANITEPIKPTDKSLPASVLNPLQIDHLNAAIDPTNYKRKVSTILLRGETVVVDPAQATSPEGVSIPLRNEIAIGGHSFSKISFLPILDNGAGHVNILLSTSTANGQLLTTASVAYRQLDGSKEVTFKLEEDRQVTIKPANGSVSITVN